MEPVGSVRNARDDASQTDRWGDVESTIVLGERFGDGCLLGLVDFSHVEARRASRRGWAR